VLNLAGILAWARGDLGAAQAAFKEALVGSTEDTDPLLGDLCGHLGLIAQAEGRFDEARERFAAALAQHRRADWQLGVVQQLMNLGSVCWALRQWSEVVRLMGEGLALARAIDHAEHRPYGLRVMGQAHLELGDTAAARSCLLSALTLLDDGAEPLQRAVVLAGLCLVELAEGRLDEAATRLRDAALAATAGGLAHERVSVLHAWGRLLFAQGRVESAAVLWLFVAAHSAALTDERRIAQDFLARACASLMPDVVAACERKAAALELDTLLTQAVSLLAPEP
jgi:tetratricopeptide (TPR) repeat protein